MTTRIYLDLIYNDGTPGWGKLAGFSVGSHDWQRREVVVLPVKPVERVDFYMLLRGHGGKAWFRGPGLRIVKPARGLACWTVCLSGRSRRSKRVFKSAT